MAKMRTGRKNGGPGDPPEKTNGDGGIVRLPMRSPQQAVRDLVESQNRKMIEQRYGKDAYKYSMNPETDETVAYSGYMGKSKGLEGFKDKLEGGSGRMSKSDYDKIVAYNQAQLQKQREYDKARRDIINQNTAATRGYEQRKAAQAQGVKNYEAAMAEGGYYDVTDWENRNKPGSKVDDISRAWYSEGRFLTPSEQEKYVKMHPDMYKNMLPGSKILMSDPEWIPYATTEPGEKKKRLEKEIYESELKRQGESLQKQPGMYGPREKYILTKAIGKPAPFTEEAPTLQDVPEERGDEYYKYKAQPVLEKTRQFKLRGPKIKEPTDPGYKDPEKVKKERDFGRPKGKNIHLHPDQRKEEMEKKRTARKQRRQEYISDLMSGSLPTSYRREGKMAKAYFGEGELGDSYEGMNRKQIQEEKQSLKKMLKEGGMSREATAITRDEIKRANLAQKYLKKAFGGKDEASRIEPGALPSEYGGYQSKHMKRGIRSFTPEKMKNYRAQQVFDRKKAAQAALEKEISDPNYTGLTPDEYARAVVEGYAKRKKIK